ncbi:MAG: hypothetical protein JNG88_10610 [Phycisphaerales bacterium]|nr:hypothetical protein [Phycisphaerales bacterium]
MARRNRSGVTRTAWLILSLVVAPLICGGCPDVRDGVVGAVERATVAASTENLGNTPQEILQFDLTRSLLGIVFDKLRSQRP